MNRRIDFAIVGAQKAGTTSFYNYLAQHPDIFVPHFKEMQFFAFDEEFQRGEPALDAYFQGVGAQPFVGFAYAHSMFLPYVMERLHARNPEMRLYACLRNPIDRAYSAWWFASQRGTETLSFEDALDAEERRTRGTWREQVQLTYLRHGHYAEQLAACADRFGRERLYVLLNEELNKNPEPTVRAAIGWMGADASRGSFTFERHNVASWPKHAWLHRWISDESLPVKKLARKLVPPRVRLTFRKHVTGRVLNWNLKPTDYPKMSPDTRERLREYYAPHNAALAAFLGRDLGHWK